MPPDPIYLHLESEQWRGIYFEKSDEKIRTIYRMLPPGKVRFFYSAGDV